MKFSKIIKKISVFFQRNWLLILITLVGGFFRFYNLNWDGGHFFHPDERNIAAAVSRIHFFDRLNPKFFAYGSLPIYLYRLAGEILSFLTKDPAWVSQWNQINLIGRWLAAFFSTLSLPLIYLLVKKIWHSQVGLLSAFFMAFSPFLIQTAHFATTESLLVFWLLALSLLSFKIIKEPSLKNYLKIGGILGLAAATKISALSFLVIPFSVHFLHHFKYLKRHGKFFLSLLIAFLVFSFFSPYVFLNQEKFWESMDYESGVALGRRKVVYVFQFEKTIPYLFQIKNFFWQMGPTALLGILGIIVLLLFAFKKKEKKILALLAFPLAYFLYVGSWYTKFIRYMIPVLPFLAIAAAWTLIVVRNRWKKTGTLLIFLSCLAAFFWSLAFFTIYTRESSRITASKWIYQNIPQGSKILQEHWDDGLPISVNSHLSSEYQTEQLTIYEKDDEGKANYYTEKLASADYLVINSRRLYGTLMFLPEKYPLTSRYYQLLFAHQLGYQKVAEFSSYPSLFGITINDDRSEETFQVYDHPKVLIFENVSRLSINKLRQLISDGE